MITEQKEIKLWKWLKGKLSKMSVDMQRIENTTGGGVPDVNLCFSGSEAWIELKVYVNGNVVLRKQQYAWLLRRERHGGNVLVLAHEPVSNEIHIFTPPFKVRPWGNKEKYVAIVSEAEYQYKKTTSVDLYIKAIFDI